MRMQKILLALVQKILLALVMTVMAQAMDENVLKKKPPILSPDDLVSPEDLDCISKENFRAALQKTDLHIKEILSECKKNPGAVRTLVMGVVGSGKSTLVNSLCGHPIKMRRDGDEFELVPETGENVLNVGGGAIPVTETPEMLYDANTGVVYFDCPGFNDPRGPLQEALNAYAIDSLLTGDAPISVLYVINYHTIAGSTGNDRFQTVVDLSNRIFELFNCDTENLQKCLAGVVSKIPHFYDVSNQQKKFVGLSPVLDILCPNTEHPDQIRVFSFPAPDARDDHDGDLYNRFDQKDVLINFIKTHAVVGMAHTMPLSEEAQRALADAISETGDMVHFPKRFGDAILKEVDENYEAKNIKQLKQWLSKVNGIKDASIENIDDFARVTSGTLPPTFIQFYEEIEEIQQLGQFVINSVRLGKAEALARACGQGIGDRLKAELENIAININLKIGVLNGEIAAEENTKLMEELESQRAKSNVEDNAIAKEIDSFKIAPGDGFFTRWHKNAHRIIFSLKGLVVELGKAGGRIVKGAFKGVVKGKVDK